MRRTIRFKVIGIAIIILVFAIGASTILNTINFTHEYSKVLRTNTMVVGNYLRLQLEKILMLGIQLKDLIGFEKSLKNIVEKYDDIDFAFVLDTSGMILFANEISYAGTNLEDSKILEAIQQPKEAVYMTMLNNKKYYVSSIPVFTKEEIHVGSILVGLPLQVITDKTSRIIFYSFILTGIFFFIGIFFFTLSMNYWVTGPLVSLITVIQEIRDNKVLDKEVTISSRDEIGHLAHVFNQMTKELEQYKNALIEKEVMNKELEIAVMIQTSLLPETDMIQNPHYDIHAEMIPASMVGGDYYDIINRDNGKIWLGIGDVSGHGILAGLIMMMLQTSALSFINEFPDIKPNQLYAKTNRVLYENIRKRLNSTHFMTLLFLCCDEEGNVDVSGKHLPVIIYRHEKQKCEIFDLKGFWSGIKPEIKEKITSLTIQLNKNDQLFLYSDGIIEARDTSHNQYGYDHLIASIEKHYKENLSSKHIVKCVLEDVKNYMEKQDDDITIVSVKKL